ncbi:toxic peptide TisB [Salmonella enterica subsp. enterica serovar Typhimurium]|nr:toxic peptide TisB [Salmonella enterica subsp. enterica serovar Typhimurium]
MCYVNTHTIPRKRDRVRNSWQQAAERYVGWQCSLTTGDAYERSGYHHSYPETHCCSTATA